MQILQMNKVHFKGYKNNYLLFCKLFQFGAEWIPTIKNKPEIIFSLKNHLHYCNSWQENVCFVYLEYCASHPRLLFTLNSFVSLALFSPGIHNSKEKKPTNNYMLIKRFFKTLIFFFCCQGHLKHFLENYQFFWKSTSDACSTVEDGVRWLTLYGSSFLKNGGSSWNFKYLWKHALLKKQNIIQKSQGLLQNVNFAFKDLDWNTTRCKTFILIKISELMFHNFRVWHGANKKWI